jgi:NADH-quinone oxidoreductase subunit L
MVALSGLPPFAGFWSKDEILADASHAFPLAYTLLTIAAFFTAFYMGRQIWLVFFGAPRSHAAEAAKESPPLVTIPLIILALLSITGGFINLPEMTEAMHGLPFVHAFGNWLEHTLGEATHAGEFELQVALISTGLALGAIALSWLLYGWKPLKAGAPDPLRRILGPIFVGMNAKWWVDELYDRLVVRPFNRLSVFLADKIDWQIWHDGFHDSTLAAGFRWLARTLADPVDLGFVDRISTVLAEGTSGFSRLLGRVQSGFARSYALAVFLGVVAIMSYIIFR